MIYIEASSRMHFFWNLDICDIDIHACAAQPSLPLWSIREILFHIFYMINEAP